MTYDFHRYANIFPLLEGEAFERLAADILDNGLIEPVVLYDGAILDGRNRYRACELGEGLRTTMEQVILRRADAAGFVWISVLRGKSVDNIEKPVIESALPDVLEALGADNLPQVWLDGTSQRPLFTSQGPQTKEPLVYFISGGDLIKIGVADYPEQRLAEISTMSPVPLHILTTTTGGYKKETELHAEFASSRSHGEWFHKTPELLSLIDSLIGGAQ